jgi:hypothetical protein
MIGKSYCENYSCRPLTKANYKAGISYFTSTLLLFFMDCAYIFAFN